MNGSDTPSESLIDSMFDDAEKVALQTAFHSNDLRTIGSILVQKGVTQADADVVLSELAENSGASFTKVGVAPVLDLTHMVDANAVDWMAPMRAEAEKQRRYGFSVLMVLSYLKGSNQKVTPDHFREMVEMTYGILEGLFR